MTAVEGQVGAGGSPGAVPDPPRDGELTTPQAFGGTQTLCDKGGS